MMLVLASRVARVVKSFHKKIREDKPKLNWLPMRRTGIWFVFIVWYGWILPPLLTIVQNVGRTATISFQCQPYQNLNQIFWGVKPLVRISIWANIYFSISAYQYSVIITIARLWRQSCLTPDLFSSYFISFYISEFLIFHCDYNWCSLSLSHNCPFELVPNCTHSWSDQRHSVPSKQVNVDTMFGHRS